MIQIDIKALENERDEILYFFKKQLEKYRALKKDIEKAEWADSNYDALIDSMNTIGKALSEAIVKLTNGYYAYILDDIIPLAKDYLAVAEEFPKIS